MINLPQWVLDEYLKRCAQFLNNPNATLTDAQRQNILNNLYNDLKFIKDKQMNLNA